MRARNVIAVAILALLAACGGGGGGSTGGGPIPITRGTSTPGPSPTPTGTPNPYQTLAPPSAQQYGVKTLSVGGDADAVAYWPDYNVGVVAYGIYLVNAADGATLATAPDGNNIAAVAYSPSTQSLVFSTGANVYAIGKTGPVTTVEINAGNIVSLAVGSDGTVYGIQTDHLVKIAGGVPTNVTPPGSFGGHYGVWPSIAVASDGSVFVSDPYDDVIFRVSTSGSITPFAGGCKTGMGATGTGGNCWRVPIAGTGTAANFDTPGALAYDPATGTLYMADNAGQQLWAISSGGVATPVAGYGSAGNVDGDGLAAFLDYPLSIAFQPASKSVDILEAAPNQQQEIVAFSSTGTAPTAFAPPAKAIAIPSGFVGDDLAASPDGGAWAAGAGAVSTAVRISPDGALTSYAFPAYDTATWHVAVDSSGTAWYTADNMADHVLDSWGVLEVTPSGTTTYFPASAQHSGASVSQLNWITIGPDGNPWFSEGEPFNGGSIGFVNRSTQTMTQFATSTTPNAISPGPGGGIAFETATIAGKTAIQYSSVSGQLANEYPLTAINALGMQYRASDSTVWFADGTGMISSIDAAGTEHDYRVCSECDPVDLTVAPDGSIWGDEGNWTTVIVRITPSGQVMQYLLPIAVGASYGISARADGKLWVYDSAGVLFLFDPAAYDAINGPHPTVLLRKPAGTGMRMRWHKWL